MDTKRLIIMASFVLACEAIGGIGAIFVSSSINNWYAFLVKPSFVPPSWALLPIWAVLYAMIGISVSFVWESRSRKGSIAWPMALFSLQLALNLLWSFVFFGLKSALFGLAEILLLWIAVAATTVKFYHVSKKASLLMALYLVWISFALLLNLYILKLNP